MPMPAPKLFQSIFTKYDGCDEDGTESYLVYDAELAQDFPPFKKGDSVAQLAVGIDTSRLEIYNDGYTHLFDLIPSFIAQPISVVDEGD